MDIWSCLKEVAILIVVCEIATAEGDLLESFRPKEDNPPELNEFLNSVLDHRSDFSYIKEAARKYQKMKKDTQDVDPLKQPMQFYTGYRNNYKTDLKRHAHSYHGLKKFHRFASMQPKHHQKKSHRYRRHLKKRTPQQFFIELDDGDGLKRRIPQQLLLDPDEKLIFKKPMPSQIFIEPQGEKAEKRSPLGILVESEGKKGELKVHGAKRAKSKKQAEYFEGPVHHATKHHKERDKYNLKHGNKQGDVYYVDLGDAAEREQARYGERRRFGFNPQRPAYFRPFDKRPNRPCAKTKEEKYDYPIYENEPHHSLNDEVAFERALSYEVEPRVVEGPNSNNPSGNNLYSVDEGRPDNIQPFYPSKEYPPARVQGYDYPQPITNERFYIDANNNLKKIESTGATASSTSTSASTEGMSTESTESTASSSEASSTIADEKKTVKQVGTGFIEVAKNRRNDEESSLQRPLVRQEEDYGGNAVFSVPFRNQPREMEVENRYVDEEARPLLENLPRPLRDEEFDEEERRPYPLAKNPIEHLQSVETSDREYEDQPVFSRDLRNTPDKEVTSKRREKQSLQTLEEKDAANEVALEPLFVEERDNKDDEEEDRDERHVPEIDAKNGKTFNQEPRNERGVEKDNEDNKEKADRDGRDVQAKDASSAEESSSRNERDDDKEISDRDERDVIAAKEVSNEIDQVVKDTVDRYSRDSPLAKKSLHSDKEDTEELVSKSSVSVNEIADEADKEMKEVDDYDHESSILSKHSLHPLRIRDDGEERFQSRKLQFIDEEMAKMDNHEEYSDVPVRARRDFLDALGMKNEEDYSEDNPYKDAIAVNNTDIHNDTAYQNFTSTTQKCMASTTTKSTMCPQKEDVKNIKEILEEPKEVTVQNTVGNFKKDKEKKVTNKRQSEGENLGNYGRKARDISDMVDAAEVEGKILENSNRIYNQREDLRNRKNNNQDAMVPTWERSHDGIVKKSVDSSHKIKKKQDNEFVDNLETTTVVPPVANYTTEGDNVNSTYEQVARQMDIENEKLAQVVNGHLATKIVSTVFDELKQKTSLRTKFYSGLSRKHVDFAGTIDFDIFKTNETEDVDEARLLLDQITKVLNKLVLNQVRRKLCQRLPDELKEYLDIILNVKNTLETANFVPNTNQGDFLFTYQESLVPPFDVRKLQETLMQLEGLLLSYNNLNEDCQNRAEPVKDYIEKHVKMLKQMMSCPSHDCEGIIENKRNSPPFHKLLIEKDLEGLGLGNQNNFVPNFDLNQLVRSKMKIGSSTKDQKRDTQKNGGYKTDKFKKLQWAAERVREKRENEAKIAELFGGKKKRSAKKFEVDYEEPVVYSLG